MEFIRGTTLVHLKIRCWSGEKKASRDNDISMGKGGKLPPKKLLAIGRKKIFPPRSLDPFNRIRKSSERCCLDKGTRFMGGYAIPDEDVDELITELEIIQESYRRSIINFLAEFDLNKQQWISDNQDFEHILRDQVPTRAAVENAFGFSIKLFKLQPLEGHDPDGDEVANQILHEVGTSCKDMSNRMLDRSTAIGGKTLKKQLEPLINKLDTLSFGNGRIITVLNEFRAFRDSVPEVRLDQNHETFRHAVTFLSMCADGEKLERIINGQFSVTYLVQGNEPQPGLDSLVNSPITPSVASGTPTQLSAGYF